MILGLDMGASAIKLAGLENGEPVFKKYIGHICTASEAVAASGLDISRVERVAATGLRSESADLDCLGVPYIRVPELSAIGRSGCFLSGRDDIIIACIGTGTAYIHAKNGEYEHMGGTGIGGGTLNGFARLLRLRGVKELDALAGRGDLANTDLLIGDLYSGDSNLDPRLTASNLAKVSDDVTLEDWAAGLENVVLQAIGSVALMILRATDAGGVVVTGKVATTEVGRRNFENFQRVYGVEYVIPPHAECATAIGAALLA